MKGEKRKWQNMLDGNDAQAVVEIRQKGLVPMEAYHYINQGTVEVIEKLCSLHSHDICIVKVFDDGSEVKPRQGWRWLAALPATQNSMKPAEPIKVPEGTGANKPELEESGNEEEDMDTFPSAGNDGRVDETTPQMSGDVMRMQLNDNSDGSAGDGVVEGIARGRLNPDFSQMSYDDIEAWLDGNPEIYAKATKVDDSGKPWISIGNLAILLKKLSSVFGGTSTENLCIQQVRLTQDNQVVPITHNASVILISAANASNKDNYRISLASEGKARQMIVAMTKQMPSDADGAQVRWRVDGTDKNAAGNISVGNQAVFTLFVPSQLAGGNAGLYYVQASGV